MSTSVATPAQDQPLKLFPNTSNYLGGLGKAEAVIHKSALPLSNYWYDERLHGSKQEAPANNLVSLTHAEIAESNLCF